MSQGLKTLWIGALALGLLGGTGVYAQAPPPLPPGLEPQPAPAPPLPPGLGGGAPTPPLPPGLGGPTAPVAPPLPPGLGEPPATPPARPVAARPFRLPFDLTGFWEARAGLRTRDDPYERQVSLGETRLQLRLEEGWEGVTLRLTTDLLFDPVLERYAVRLEEGTGVLDLREASLLLRPAGFMDLKLGRQILTWGTGDLLFINDLFPKDFNAFFIGRDTEYLKAPADALKVGLFSPLANLEVVYTPRFDADRFIDGRRISFFNTALGRRSGRDAIVQAELPDTWFADAEIAWRLSRTLSGYELALYGYRGFWKSPAGAEAGSGRATFPPLAVYGVSVRGTVGKGIANLEVGYYDSEDDRDGDDPLVRNSEVRFLVGYEQEAARNLTVGVQYYLEQLLQYDAFRRALPPGSPVADESRHLLTLRLTKLLLRQNLRLSLFTFYSPSDVDAYLRPQVHYKIDDHWAAEIGGNVFVGKEAHSFFGQFANNSNVYVGVRYGF